MIICKTPLRISFFGGGTDYPDYFSKFGEGTVLGTAIDKFVYHSISKFYSQLFDYSIRISYRKVECVNSLDEIEHVPFRECLREHGITNDIEVDFTAELPAYSGLGSSSSFVVGLLNSLYAYRNKSIEKLALAKEAIRIEREVLHEPVGYQDQTFAAVGGINFIKFSKTGEISVEPVILDEAKKQNFEDHLMLFFSGIQRRANTIIKNQIMKVEENQENLGKMREFAYKGFDILQNSSTLEGFGELLDKNWKMKKQLHSTISNENIDEIYEKGIKGGALGGKLLGAGGGGFIVFFVPPKNKKSVRQQLSQLTEIPIKISDQGSQILNSN